MRRSRPYGGHYTTDMLPDLRRRTRPKSRSHNRHTALVQIHERECHSAEGTARSVVPEVALDPCGDTGPHEIGLGGLGEERLEMMLHHRVEGCGGRPTRSVLGPGGSPVGHLDRGGSVSDVCSCVVPGLPWRSVPWITGRCHGRIGPRPPGPLTGETQLKQSHGARSPFGATFESERSSRLTSASWNPLKRQVTEAPSPAAGANRPLRTRVYLLSAWIMVAALLLAARIPELPLRKTHDRVVVE